MEQLRNSAPPSTPVRSTPRRIINWRSLYCVRETQKSPPGNFTKLHSWIVVSRHRLPKKVKASCPLAKACWFAPPPDWFPPVLHELPSHEALPQMVLDRRQGAHSSVR